MLGELPPLPPAPPSSGQVSAAFPVISRVRAQSLSQWLAIGPLPARSSSVHLSAAAYPVARFLHWCDQQFPYSVAQPEEHSAAEAAPKSPIVVRASVASARKNDKSDIV